MKKVTFNIDQYYYSSIGLNANDISVCISLPSSFTVLTNIGSIAIFAPTV